MVYQLLNRPQIYTRAYTPSPICWMGSKRTFFSKYGSQIPFHKRFIDPFVGGGNSIPYAGKCAHIIINDLYPILAESWILIRSFPDIVLEEYKTRYEGMPLEKGEDKAYFYSIRDRFNNSPNPHDFIYLMRTCISGLCRFNQKGKYNSAFGKRGATLSMKKKYIDAYAIKLQNSTILCGDYQSVIPDKDDFVFLDPPYDMSDTMYANSHVETGSFYDYLELCSQRGAKWMLTFNTKEIGGRELPEELYKSKVKGVSIASPINKIRNQGHTTATDFVYANFPMRNYDELVS